VKIGFDHNVPRYLLEVFAGVKTATARSRGWEGLSNGHLLSAAEEGGFDLLATLHRRFSHQQSMSNRRIAGAILAPENQQMPAFDQAARQLMTAMNELRPGSVAIFGRK
jgi:hypothetical protein